MSDLVPSQRARNEGYSDIPFNPHPLEWDPGKVGRFWDFYASTGNGEFFSDVHSGDLARRIIRAGRPSTFLDIGCGTGPLVIELSNRGVRAMGVDSSRGVLDEARRRAKKGRRTIEFLEGSAVSIPLPDGSVDAASLIEVVEHLDDVVLMRALAEARRVVRPGGALVITTPNREDLRLSTVQCQDCGAEFHTMQHVRTWTRSTLMTALRTAGFDVRSIDSLRFVPNGPLAGRLLRRLYYTVRRQRPRLIAIAMRPAVD